MDLVLPDQVPDRRVGDHDLQGQDPALAVAAGQQLLGDDPFKDEGKLGADLGLLVRRKNVDDPVNGLGAAVGVQGGHGQVAGFGHRQRRGHGFQVAQFADQDHVRVLTKDVAQGLGKGFRVRFYFPLVDDAFFMGMDKFYRVLDGDDVFVAFTVDLVDHCRQGG